jgi:hypothetical protein
MSIWTFLGMIKSFFLFHCPTRLLLFRGYEIFQCKPDAKKKRTPTDPMPMGVFPLPGWSLGSPHGLTSANPMPPRKRSQWLHRCSWKNRVGVVRTFGSYQSATTRTSQLFPLLPLHLFPRFWLGRLLINCPQYRQSKRALWYFAYFSRPKSWGNRQTIYKDLWCGHSPSTKW